MKKLLGTVVKAARRAICRLFTHGHREEVQHLKSSLHEDLYVVLANLREALDALGSEGTGMSTVSPTVLNQAVANIVVAEERARNLYTALEQVQMDWLEKGVRRDGLYEALQEIVIEAHSRRLTCQCWRLAAAALCDFWGQASGQWTGNPATELALGARRAHAEAARLREENEHMRGLCVEGGREMRRRLEGVAEVGAEALAKTHAAETEVARLREEMESHARLLPSLLAEGNAVERARAEKAEAEVARLQNELESVATNRAELVGVVSETVAERDAAMAERESARAGAAGLQEENVRLRAVLERIQKRAAAQPVHICEVADFDLDLIAREAAGVLAGLSQ